MAGGREEKEKKRKRRSGKHRRKKKEREVGWKKGKKERRKEGKKPKRMNERPSGLANFGLKAGFSGRDLMYVGFKKHRFVILNKYIGRKSVYNLVERRRGLE